jgi:hypothetical protein
MRFILAFLVAPQGVYDLAFSSPKVWFQAHQPVCRFGSWWKSGCKVAFDRQEGVNRVPQDTALQCEFGFRVVFTEMIRLRICSTNELATNQ